MGCAVMSDVHCPADRSPLSTRRGVAQDRVFIQYLTLFLHTFTNEAVEMMVLKAFVRM